ncbi:MAG: PLP-dependent aspartate aminotransferase family protein [Gammaproteobacteria bacterium]|nr:PLP-dependent aspartate aminotransferase family protein [Gammaproteobacteria bacterium]
MSKQTTALETLLVHAGREPEADGAVGSALSPSTTYVRDAGPHVYSRYSNPTRDRFEAAIAAIEGARQSFAFASGMAAASAVFNLLKPGDHLLLGEDCYHGVRRYLQDELLPKGIEFSLVDTTDIGSLAAAVRPTTRMIWFETPSNPQLRVTDLGALAAWAGDHELITVCDSTLAPPIIQRPLARGIDISMHSATKFIGGHSDLLAGVVSCHDEELAEAIGRWQGNAGAVPSAFDCWLLLRSLSTLSVRVRQQCDSALRVASWLAGHPEVEKVFYPGLAGAEGHEVAATQMVGFGGLLSFCLRGDEERARKLAQRTRLFIEATSLGGVESLIEHRASIEGEHRRSPDNLLRLSIGLEHVDDLLADLEAAIASL